MVIIHKKLKFYKLFFILLISIIFVSTITNSLVHANRITKFELDLSISEDTKIPDDLKKDIKFALNSWRKKEPKRKTFYIVNELFGKDNDWGLVIITTAELKDKLTDGEEGEATSNNTYPVLFIRVGQKWIVTFEGDSKLKDILNKIPEDEFTIKQKRAFFPSLNLQAAVPANSSFKLPFEPGVPWVLSSGRAGIGEWHNEGEKNLDFVTSSTNKNIVASYDGVVTLFCQAINTSMSKQGGIIIKKDSSSNQFGYHHLDYTSMVNANIHFGSTISRGQALGHLYTFSGTVTNTTNCQNSAYGNYEGSATIIGGSHLHYEVPYKDVVLDGYTFPTTFSGTDLNPTSLPPKLAYTNTVFTSPQIALDPCLPPSSGDWTLPLNKTCTISTNVIFNQNIIIPNAGDLVIESGASLKVDLQNKGILIKNGGRLLVRNGGKVY